ncbi:MAG: thiolase domain-containing protein [Candidatus Diapherotrites archaeon]|uniref:Thiolase domain-containing protein n=1 Tax=Candidatus Iainarchaeum sp. TaxID=3101447 RepID=A0A8T3YJY4_9ARCH|nr:thiolase domain-containing protein [Candidatus Diapherotrites archaeon]
MRSVSIVGAGLTRFSEHWSLSFKELIAEAGVKAIHDSGLARKDIQAVYGGCMASGRFIGQEHIGALIADQLGLNPIPATRLEAACASGGVALRNGYMAVASGMHDIVAVGGIEKMTEVSTEDAGFALGGAGDQETELFMGASFPALYALMARAHMQKFGTTEEQLAAVAVKNHKNAEHNEYAQFRNEITIDQVMNSGYIASPLKLLDCSPISDGAAAVILCAADVAKKMKMADKAVEIIASAQTSDTLALAQRKNLWETASAKIAAEQAYKQAGIKPSDVSFAEVHDCFTIAEIMAIEALGFCKQGEGGKFTEQGNTRIGGKIPVNTSGGLKACGHPVGATGIKQAIEAYWQLNNMAGKRQVKGAEIGLTHNVGGSGATAVIHLYRKM